MTMESRATLAAFRTLKRVSGVTITIRRGVLSGEVTAVAGDTIVEREDESDLLTSRMKIRDYLVETQAFESIVGAGEKPKRGDEFIEVVAGHTRTFQAMELSGETFRWWDKAGQVLRIHTVETEAVTTTTGTTTTTTSGV